VVVRGRLGRQEGVKIAGIGDGGLQNQSGDYQKVSRPRVQNLLVAPAKDMLGPEYPARSTAAGGIPDGIDALLDLCSLRLNRRPDRSTPPKPNWIWMIELAALGAVEAFAPLFDLA